MGRRRRVRRFGGGRDLRFGRVGEELVEPEDAQQGGEGDHEHERREDVGRDQSGAAERDRSAALHHDRGHFATRHHARDDGHPTIFFFHHHAAHDLADHRRHREQDGEEEDLGLEEGAGRHLRPDEEEEHRGGHRDDRIHRVLQLVVMPFLSVTQLLEQQASRITADEGRETRKLRAQESEEEAQRHRRPQDKLRVVDLDRLFFKPREDPNPEEERHTDEADALRGFPSDVSPIDGSALRHRAGQGSEGGHHDQTAHVVQDGRDHRGRAGRAFQLPLRLEQAGADAS